MMRGYSVNLLRHVRNHLKNGGIIAYPTEHCYGIGCDPYNYKAIDKIIRLKQRDKNKGLIVIAGNIKQLQNLVVTPTSSELADYWPGGYTLLLPTNNDQLPKNLAGRHPKLAVRVTKHMGVIQLCGFLESALVSTSANYSGFNPAKNLSACVRQFGSKLMILPGMTNNAKRPSIIMDWSSKKILR